MNRYFFYIAAAAALLTAACTKEPLKEEEPVIPVTGITHNLPATLEVLVGATLTLEADVEPAEATNQTVTWNTSDDRVATVNPEGEITAVAPGTATITVAADDGAFTATCIVTVAEEVIPVTGVITMSTQASEVNISVWIKLSAEIVNFSIDWGDGKKSKIYESSYMPPWPDFAVDFRFEHNYSGASEHLITITGNNIELLSCGYNKLTSLDISRCPELKTLYCWDNQLTKVNVSGNIELKSLECRMNQLSTLDVSNCTALEVLSLSGNPLTALDVSNCTALISLSVSYCQLIALDVSKCTELEQLWCPGNKLKSLDVSHNTELRLLPCDMNLFTADELNDLFRSLPYISERNPYWDYDCPLAISIYGNPGTDDCDFSIAEKKGWCQRGIMPASKDVP